MAMEQNKQWDMEDGNEIGLPMGDGRLTFKIILKSKGESKSKPTSERV